MAKKWIDEETGNRMIEPNTVSEYLFMIWALGYDYDGCGTIESLKGLVDELVSYADKAMGCLYEGRIFPSCEEPHLNNVPQPEEMKSIYEKIRENIESTWPDWKIQFANDELITSKHGVKLRTGAQKQRQNERN